MLARIFQVMPGSCYISLGAVRLVYVRLCRVISGYVWLGQARTGYIRLSG
jgi:hypothetical protein